MSNSLSISKKSKKVRNKPFNLFIRAPQSNILSSRIPFTNQILQRAYDTDKMITMLNQNKTARTQVKSKPKLDIENIAPLYFETSQKAFLQNNKVRSKSNSMIVKKKSTRKKINLNRNNSKRSSSKITQQAQNRSLSIKSRNKKNRSLQPLQINKTQLNYFNNNLTQIGTQFSRYKNYKNSVVFDNSIRDFRGDYQRVLNQLSQKSAFIFTQQKQIQHLLKKVKALRAQNQEIRQDLTKTNDRNYQNINNFSQNNLKNDYQLKILQSGLQDMKQKVDIISIQKQQLANKYRTNQLQHDILICKYNDLIKQNQFLRQHKIKSRDLQFKFKQEKLKVQSFLNDKTSYQQKLKLIENEGQLKIKSLQHLLNKIQQQLKFSQNKTSETLKKFYLIQQENKQLNKKIHNLKCELSNNNNLSQRQEQIYKRRIYQSEQVIKSQRQRIQLYEKAAVKSQEIINNFKIQLDKINSKGDAFNYNFKNNQKQYQDVQNIQKIAEYKGLIIQLQRQINQINKNHQKVLKQNKLQKENVLNLNQCISKLEDELNKMRTQAIEIKKYNELKLQKDLNQEKFKIQTEKLFQSKNALQKQVIFLKQQQEKLQQKIKILEQQNKTISLKLSLQSQQFQQMIISKDKTIKQYETKIETLQIRLKCIQQSQGLSNITALSDSNTNILFNQINQKQNLCTKVVITHQNHYHKNNHLFNKNNQKIIEKCIVLKQMKQSPNKNKKKPLEPLFNQSQSQQNENANYLDIQSYAKRQLQILTKLKYLDSRFESQKTQNIKLSTIIKQKDKNISKLQKNNEKLIKQINQLQINTHSIRLNAQNKVINGMNNIQELIKKKDSQINDLKSKITYLNQQKNSLDKIIQQLNKQKEFLVQQKTKIEKQLLENKYLLTQMKQKIENLTSQKNLQLFKSSKVFQSKLLQNQIHLEKTQFKIQSLTDVINCQQNKINQMSIILKDKQSFINETNHCYSMAKKQIQSFKSKSIIFQTYSQQNIKIKQDINFLQNQLNNVVQQNNNLKYKIEQKQRCLALFNQKIAMLQNKLQEKQTILKIKQKAIIQLQNKIKKQQNDQQQYINKNYQQYLQKITKQNQILKTNLQKQQSYNNQYRKDIQCKNWQIDILKKQNLNIQELMKQQLGKRKVVIQQLIQQKKNLYQQLKNKKY